MKKDKKSTFEAIYKNESDAIFRFCLLRVSNRDQALDLVQETFLRLWQSLQKDEDILNSKAFLFTITRHLIIDYYRKKKSIPFKDMASTDEEEGYDPANDITTDNLISGIEGRYLLNKINELPQSYREPLYLRFVEDLSPPEIGEILGVSANAASVRINRGLEELRRVSGYSKDDLNKLNI
ncbi:MAG: RNA polymerase sigma factor SigW [Candidatus Nomurabacteria bacterium GW2011_GWF2_35_66]|uniref:RNA polymerase sigma factor SigW n=1 Tax=Candidatus Nomurabacteria bacterium GW2011_GWE1_35_16 TaxID=1618761 RepID=A0A0G0EHS1_9BACT|nr:MAG: RNA polymerase sigma factor SigW [Candidatus Nomurabacteria bacterium GW2011_GWF1_34_20]KKP63650.1 MAG: RNA polymerase sigma factor SigW [Candidatus Nomurabacteria bacterium GW2011_GWE2_34_25]KKP66852.1 MAG: RNA polymerase sigma factor SigW [Candidatus Nomurabacteria bacterium GW2011_GWE1_35_16]KKP83478.1 MAG: RNA polymerase sigma factor SigW [Candidatus Nomurabacteria bacterium GW2011_GWF2_35_66]HAE36590.1 hypothetical protein [Candidatus Nomurabacteria bacterium]